MNTALTVTRSALRYHGGKWRIAPWIISHFPPHDLYCEPYGGGASILLRKNRVRAEIYNDIDSEIVNVFQVMRDEVKAKKLEKLLYYTPYSRDEFNNTYTYNAVDEIEQARITIVRSFMGFGSSSTTSKHRTGFRISCRNNHYPHIDFASYPKIITQFTERLRGVIIENRDAMQVMKKFDSKETLHYIDPPYIASLRNKSHAKYAYSKEMTDREHEELCEFVKTLQGYVVCSGYNNDIYNTILDSWAVYSKETIAEKAKRTVECLWLSPRTAAALTAKRPRLTGIA